ncbi:hypothetical protein R3X27_02925 [Tropicimonas sp. TH_r6]|uniref:hypothetical protein n=1 Tax=Tropicimonas sp. TH_r6 TaxID=3082085 RepID=UPI002954A6AD|nr:hypothetical protein [Tropicimonas sp. TH_r6]MDV7141628.1 hypothetical protein [Tropicimonas sp. TH_r6]
MGKRIYLRFKRFGLLCEFIKNGYVCGSFDGRNYYFESTDIGLCQLEEYPGMMALNPRGAYSKKFSRFQKETGILTINLGARKFHLFLRDRKSLLWFGSSISLSGNRVGCFWMPKGLFPMRRYLEIDKNSDIADWEAVLLAFFASYLPDAATDAASAS